MDAITGFFAQLLASTGLGVSKEAALFALLVLAVMIVVVALARSRRSHRLEVHLEDPRQSHAGMREAEPAVVPAHGPVSDALSDSDRSKQTAGGADRQEFAPSGNPGGIAADGARSGETFATNVPRTRVESAAAQTPAQNYQARFELMHATLSSLQREQLALRKLLENCNSGLKGIEQLAAAIPSLRTEHASIKKQLAELTARFDVASEILADLLESEDPPRDR